MGKKTSVNYEALAPLLQANSEQDLVQICRLALVTVTDSAIVQCARLLAIETAHSGQVLQSIQDLAADIKSKDSGRDSQDSFPDKFPKSAAALLTTIIKDVSKETEARQAPHYVPQLEAFDWRLDIKAADNNCTKISAPSCLLQMQLQDDTSDGPKQSYVNVEITRESMTTLLDGLGKIRDQLSGIAN